MLSALKRFWEKVAWHLNRRLVVCPGLLGFFGARVTVIDQFGAPGDTLLTATVCRELKRRHSRLQLNCVTPNPALLEHEPAISSLNGPRGFFYYYFSYLDLIEAKDGKANVLRSAMLDFGLTGYEYRARVYLTDEERTAARQRLAGLKGPCISINAMSREAVKNWPLAYWTQLVGRLQQIGTVVQLGDNKEPHFPGVVRFAGKLSLRESMAVLAEMQVHVGPDSFLMHAANGVDVPSVIIFGGSRLPATLGYAENVNLENRPECSPCWLHTTRGEVCPHELKCLTAILPDAVLEAVGRQLSRVSAQDRLSSL